MKRIEYIKFGGPDVLQVKDFNLEDPADVDEDGYYTPSLPGPDGYWNTGDDIPEEPYSDTNGDGSWTPKDYTPTWQTGDDVIDYPSSYYAFSALKLCYEGSDVSSYSYYYKHDHIDNNMNSTDYVDINGNGYPNPGDYNPLSAGLDGEWGTKDDDMAFSTGVNPDGYVFADGKDNDGDGLIDELIDEMFCYDPNQPNIETIEFADSQHISGIHYGSHVFHISMLSPALDAGDPTLALDKDGSIVDIGALHQFYFPAGCTDPDAANYNIFSSEDDGSCEYIDNCEPLYFPNTGVPIVCREVVDGVDNDDDWHGVSRFPYYANNAFTGCEVYQSCFDIDYNNPIFNTDWYNLFGWENEDPDNPQWGYVDYITCGGTDIDSDNVIDYPHGSGNGVEVDCSGHINYTTGLNAAYGDTIGITIYQPEDVVDFIYGTIQYGNHAQAAQYWYAVGIDEYDVISRVSYPAINFDYQWTDYQNPEEFIDENSNNIYDAYYYNEIDGIIAAEEFVDANDNGSYDAGGFDLTLTWGNPSHMAMISINDVVYPIGITYIESGDNTEYMYNFIIYMSSPYGIPSITVDTTTYQAYNIPPNQQICYLIQPTASATFPSNNLTSGCLVSPDVETQSDEEDCDDEDLLGISGIPEQYELRSNYPNPFNPTTTIPYAIPENTYVTLTAYDLLGRKIETLYKGYQTAGYYTLQWNALAYASGTYFIQIKTDNFIRTQKMTLVK